MGKNGFEKKCKFKIEYGEIIYTNECILIEDDYGLKGVLMLVRLVMRKMAFNSS